MFAIFKNNRKTKTLYPTYESARQALRRRLRKTERGWTVLTPGNNPPHSVFGYTIRQV